VCKVVGVKIAKLYKLAHLAYFDGVFFERVLGCF
jgi:hypothetical protein